MELGIGMNGALAALIIFFSVFFLISMLSKSLEKTEVAVKERPENSEEAAVYGKSASNEVEIFNNKRWIQGKRCGMKGGQVVVHINGQPDNVFHNRSLDNVRPIQ